MVWQRWLSRLIIPGDSPDGSLVRPELGEILVLSLVYLA